MVEAVLGRNWIIDAAGRPIHIDFTGIYAAGSLVRHGAPAAAYDWTLHHFAENTIVGRDATSYFGWHYPPPFLIVAGLLACLPYAGAFFVWLAATLSLYLATIRLIIGERIGWLVAGALPCLIPNLMTGQNGFLTASLVGGTLLLLQEHPLAAGCCLGLLSYKPQFAVLLPLALMIGGHWRTIGVATLTGVALVLATVALFGVSTWEAFFHWLPLSSTALLSHDHAGWYKLQSLFALVRMLGGGAALAWTLQVGLTALAACVLCAMWWNRRIAFELKAAAAAACVPLATPYVYLYDLSVLGVAGAFFLRHVLATGFRSGEIAGLAVITALLLIMPFLDVPVGLIVTLILASLIARRAFFPQVARSAIAADART